MATEQEIAASEQFSTSDYGRTGDQRPYQIVRPAYPAPVFLQSYTNLSQALRECSTMCTLQGKPFRVVCWAGSGGRGCQTCKTSNRTNRFPTPVAEFQPNGVTIVFGPGGCPQKVGQPRYAVCASPSVPAAYDPKPLKQTYAEAVASAQVMATQQGRRVYVCSDFGNCKRNSKYVPVVYVDPGGLTKVFPDYPTGTATVNTVSPSHFKELIAQSQGRTLLGQGA